MNLIFEMAELLVNTFEIYLIFQYFLYLKLKPKKYYILPLTIAELVLIILYLFFTYSIADDFYLLLIPAIINIFCNKPIQRTNIIYNCLCIILIVSIEDIILNTIRTSLKIVNYNINTLLAGLFVLIITVLLWLYFAHYITIRYHGYLKIRQPSFFAFIAIISLLNAGIYSIVINNIYNYGLKLYKRTKLVECFLFFFGIALIAEIIYIIFLYYEKTHHSVVSTFTQKYLDIEKAHFEEYQQKTDDTRHFRHDIENHLSIMNHHAQTGNITKLTNYLQNLSTSFSTLIFKYRTANETINGILNKADHDLEANHINLSINGKLDDFKVIDDFDLCTIFSNALYNSIEACMKIPEPLERWITIHFRSQGNMYFIYFANTVAENISLIEGRPRSTKVDHNNHGFGLIQIEHIVSSYNGDLQFKCENNTFELTVMLRNGGE